MGWDAYWQRLKETGWLDSVPESRQDALRVSVESALEKLRGPAALITGQYDSECIEDDDDYTRLIELYADASYGKVRPEEVGAKIDWENKRATISITLNGKEYERTFAHSGDYVSDEFDDSLNSILQEAGIEECFFQLPSTDQIVNLSFATHETVQKAVAAGLLPGEVLKQFNKGEESKW